MKEVIVKLEKYFNENEINELLNKFENSQRANIMNDSYFAKIGNNTNELFFNNLIKEINLYVDNKNNNNLPNIIDSYVDKNICLLVLEKIDAKTIGNNRNEFNLHLSKKKRKIIIESILEIKNLKINGILDKKYNRKDYFKKYFSKSLPYLSKYETSKLGLLKNSIIEESEYVISHGDLISTNIMLKNNSAIFIDWEYISFKPKYYDLMYFLLFSKTNKSLEILKELDFDIDLNDLYKDAIILCLKEIQNNAKLFNHIDNKIVEKNINRWKSELNYILGEL